MSAHHSDVILSTRGDRMGRIGKTYPRFDEATSSPGLLAEDASNSAVQVTGAIIGILGALGFIGWLLSR
jgi:hypothetical protein